MKVTQSPIGLRSFGRALLMLTTAMACGLAVGVLLPEGVLQANPRLLLRGMALPFPVDAPLSERDYDVRFSDADLLYWRPDLIAPLAENKVEAHVTYTTDLWGFRNERASEPIRAVALGSSVTVGAQVAQPWPEVAAEALGWTILNLAQPASTLDLNLDYYRHFGEPTHPEWAIIEIMPDLYMLGDRPLPPLLVQRFVPAAIQQTARQLGAWPPAWTPGSELYPMRLTVGGGAGAASGTTAARDLSLTCCVHLMEIWSLTPAELERAQAWQDYAARLSAAIAEIQAKVAPQANGACVAILYVPRKPAVYFPLVTDPSQLDGIAAQFTPWAVDPGGQVVAAPEKRLDGAALQAHATATRDVLAAFAAAQPGCAGRAGSGLVFIDPTAALQASVLAGVDPYLVYDEHWNQTGQAIVGKLVAEALQDGVAP